MSSLWFIIHLLFSLPILLRFNRYCLLGAWSKGHVVITKVLRIQGPRREGETSLPRGVMSRRTCRGIRDIKKAIGLHGKGRKGSVQPPRTAGWLCRAGRVSKQRQPKCHSLALNGSSLPLSAVSFSLFITCLWTYRQISFFLLQVLLILWPNSVTAVTSLLWGFAKPRGPSWWAVQSLKWLLGRNCVLCWLFSVW